MSELMLDAAGRRRSPATMPEFHAGRPPRNKGLRYPADPPTIEEIIAVMRQAGDSVHGRRLRGLIVVLWRAGLRICEALALAEADLDSNLPVNSHVFRVEDCTGKSTRSHGLHGPRGQHRHLSTGQRAILFRLGAHYRLAIPDSIQTATAPITAPVTMTARTSPAVQL